MLCPDLSRTTCEMSVFYTDEGRLIQVKTNTDNIHKYFDAEVSSLDEYV